MSTEKNLRVPPEAGDFDGSEAPTEKQLRLESESEGDDPAHLPLPVSSDDEWEVVDNRR